MHLIFKVATIIMAVAWLIGVGMEAVQVFQLFGGNSPGGSVVLDPLGQPWRTWFKEQTNMVLAPLITIFILWLLAFLAKPTKRG